MDGKRCKVLQISSYPPPLSGWGMRVYVLKRVMEKQGHICEVLNIGKGRFLHDRDFVPVLGGLDYIRKIFKFRLKGYLIHMHLNGDSPKGFILTLLSLFISLLTFHRPVITFHAGPVQKYFPQSQAPQLNLVYKIIFSLPRHIICNNEIVKKAISGYGIRPQKIVPIQAFTKQYLAFERISLPEEIEAFFKKFPNMICTYVFLRPEFFAEEMLEAFSRLAKQQRDTGLLIMGLYKDDEKIMALLAKFNLNEHAIAIGNQPHDVFLTVLSRSKIYWRTPVKDGVCSSVLEALSLGVPVVAAENGTRPESVITYQNKNIPQVVEKLRYVLDNHDAAVKSIIKPEIRDTTAEEIAVLMGE
jgi:glycosyltransferase involved in cell wall biosynthesis